MGRIRELIRNRVFSVVLLLSTLVPATISVPMMGSQASYLSAYEPTYPPSYESAPSYQPSYKSSRQPPSYEQSYTRSYDPPNYQPSYSPPSYTASYEPPNYQSNYQPSYQHSYQPSYLPKAYNQETHKVDAIAYKELNVSLHCGVVPATNDEFYQASKDLAPFGKYPWVVQITDEYNKLVCQGVMIHKRYVLTASSCIYGSTDDYRVRVDDWDILTNYNEYEPYKNARFRIVNAFPVSYDYSSSSYSYGGANSKLLIMEINTGTTLHDKYPAARHICLPTYHQQYYSPPSYSPPDYQQPSYEPTYEPSYQPSYSPPAYQPPSYEPSYQPRYRRQATYGYQPSNQISYQPSYSPPSYQPTYQLSYEPQNYSPPSYQPSYQPPSYAPSYSPPAYSECWVVGWYGSEATQLRNHPQPTEQEEYYSYPQHSYGGYGHQRRQYYQDYDNYDLSNVERRAKVKKVKCPSYQSPKKSYGYKYQAHQDDDVCFVGEDGYDACVADKGAAIFCLVPEKHGYEAGYDNYGSYQSYQPHEYGRNPYPRYDNSYYKKDITAHPSPQKQSGQRAVLYAIVQKPTKCSSISSYDNSSKCTKRANYKAFYPYRRKPRPLRATPIDKETVESIIQRVFWEPPDYRKY